MSINCANECLHQMDGYCFLEELPSASQVMVTESDNEIDCPYFKPTIS